MKDDNGRQIVRALPEELFGREGVPPSVFVDCSRVDLRSHVPETVARVNETLYGALATVAPGVGGRQALVKVHIGEPKCVTRMRPEYVTSSVQFLHDHGIEGVVAGDTTVAYSGPRGYQQNPPDRLPHAYQELASRHGWSVEGAAGVPFVVLDRPASGVAGCFEFHGEESKVRLPARAEHFSDCFLAGGFTAADVVINHAHLTLHGLAGVAGCVKALAMGCSSLRGKLRMHQSLLPAFDGEKCLACGRCVTDCPTHALTIDDEGQPPTVDCERCIGCGECEAVCQARAVVLKGREIGDWQRGQSTFSSRLADYALAMLACGPQHLVHVLHMYTITERCDCLNRRQNPMTTGDLGFLVGVNPFALDLWAARLLATVLPDEQRPTVAPLLGRIEELVAYAEQRYGLSSNSSLETISVD